jgi:hypothetical protein
LVKGYTPNKVRNEQVIPEENDELAERVYGQKLPGVKSNGL